MPRFQRLPSSREPSIWDAYQGEYPAITAWPAPTYQYWYPYPFTSPVVNPPTGTTAAEQKSPAEKLANPEEVGTPPTGGASAPFLPAASGGMQSPAAANPMAGVLPPAVEGAFDASPGGGEGGLGTGSPGPESSLSQDSPVTAISLGQTIGTPSVLSTIGAAGRVGVGPNLTPTVGLNPFGLVLEGIRGIFSDQLQRAGTDRLGEMEGQVAGRDAAVAGDVSGRGPAPGVDLGVSNPSAQMSFGGPIGRDMGSVVPASFEETGMRSPAQRESEQHSSAIRGYNAPPALSFDLPYGGVSSDPVNTVNFGGPPAPPAAVTEGFQGVEPGEAGRMGGVGLPSFSDPGPTAPSGPAPDLGMGLDFGGGVDAGGGPGGGDK